MGTNYYIIMPQARQLDQHDMHKLQSYLDNDNLDQVSAYFTEEKLSRSISHLGKYSAGWKFALSADKFETWSEWKEFLNLTKPTIEDEYGNQVDSGKIIELVESTKDLLWLRDLRYEKKDECPDYQSEFLDPDGYRMVKGDFC